MEVLAKMKGDNLTPDHGVYRALIEASVGECRLARARALSLFRV